MLNIRKLVALDMSLHGAPLIIFEFAAGIAIAGALGVLSLIKGSAAWQAWLGIYLCAVALNYVPLLLWALSLGSRRQASAIAGAEAQDRAVLRRYTARSFLLLIPILVPVLAIAQVLGTPRR